jgi:hypothetical protein
LLQGLTVCRHCGYAYYGKIAPRTRGYDRTNVLRYYRCTGADGYRLAKDFEATIDSAVAWVFVVNIRTLARRIASA